MDNLVGKIQYYHFFLKMLTQFPALIYIYLFIPFVPLGNERAYYERSPINFVNQFTCPVILFQGLEDKVFADHEL
jgi:dipeptidyl aminopeptidase/acylaminoacyl peptidase